MKCYGEINVLFIGTRSSWDVTLRTGLIGNEYLIEWLAEEIAEFKSRNWNREKVEIELGHLDFWFWEDGIVVVSFFFLLLRAVKILKRWI